MVKDYAVILFKNEKKGKKIVELLPSSWLYEVENGIFVCLYPEEKDWPKVISWTQEKKTPLSNWIEHTNIKILCYAGKNFNLYKILLNN